MKRRESHCSHRVKQVPHLLLRPQLVKEGLREDAGEQRGQHVVVDGAQTQLESGYVRGISFFGVQFRHPDSAAFAGGQFADLARGRVVSVRIYMDNHVIAVLD